MDITVQFPGGKKVDAVAEGHVIRTDQSAEHGGEGTAPEPFTVFLASLATCAGIYVLGFCQARSIPTDGISLVQHNEFDADKKKLLAVSIDVRLPATFPERYRDAVRRAAENCKVKKTMFEPPALEVITTTTPAT